MEEGLFKKHILHIQTQKNLKNELLAYIHTKTGIQLQESMVTISKKGVVFRISSVIKQKLYQHNIQDLLKEKGYTVRH